jgi:putative membrane protein
MPYSRFCTADLTLRDYLARDRTVLANERTLLSYVRTAIGLLAAGGTLLTLFPGSWSLRALGMMCLVLGVVVVGFGIWRFATVASRLQAIGALPADE